MTAKEPIEEMAKILRNKRVEQGFENYRCYMNCENCPSKQYYCVEREYAEVLYDTGYRKIPDGYVVLSPEQRDEEVREINAELAEHEQFVKEVEGLLAEKNDYKQRYESMCKKYESLTVSSCEALRKKEINAHKETAEQIISFINSLLIEMYSDSDFAQGKRMACEIVKEEIIKKYGLEVDQ